MPTISVDTSRTGIMFFVPPCGEGITAYNNTGYEMKRGDVAYLAYGGTVGQEFQAKYPAANSDPRVYALIALEDIAYQSIGKYCLRGECWAMVNGTNDLSVGEYLECIAEDGVFDGTVTNLAFVAGSGSTYDTITDSDSGFVTDVFVAGAHIGVAGATTSGNNATWTHSITTAVAAATLTLTTIGALTSEAGVSGLTMKMQGILESDGGGTGTRSTGSIALAMQAFTSDYAALKKIMMIGEQIVMATS